MGEKIVAWSLVIVFAAANMLQSSVMLPTEGPHGTVTLSKLANPQGSLLIFIFSCQSSSSEQG